MGLPVVSQKSEIFCVQTVPHETLVHAHHFGHVTQPAVFLAFKELDQLSRLEPLFAGGAQGAQEVRRRSGLPVYRCNGKNNSVLVG